MFKSLFSSEICAALKRFGGSPAPLSLIGTFLNYVGNNVLYYIYEKFKKRVFYPFSEVISIKHLPSGELITTVITSRDGIEMKIQFKSKAVVISNGGKPSIPREIFNNVSTDKLITADYFLKKEGFESFINTLNKNQAKRKIVIVGGSHSGFSCAWVLLNGPAWYNYNKNGCKLVFDCPPGGKLYTCKNTSDCGNYLSDSYTKCSTVESTKECHCFGAFNSEDIWRYEKPKKYPQFENADITILYKEKIKVFYSQVKNAAADGYTEYKPHCFRNPNGYLYSFTGLRGDAKTLYQDVVNGKEKRVRLIQAETWTEQQKYVNGADYIILAWGYQTAKLVIMNTEGKDIRLDARVSGTQFDIDNKFRIRTYDGGALCKVFGSGLAYPTRTNDGKTVPEAGKPNPRADSFSLYLNYVGTKVLDSLLPKSKLNSKSQFIYTDKALK